MLGQGEISLHSAVQEGKMVAVHCDKEGNQARTAPELFRVKLNSWGSIGSLLRAAIHVPSANNVLQAWPEQPHARAHRLWSNDIIKGMKPRAATESVPPEVPRQSGGMVCKQRPAAQGEVSPFQAIEADRSITYLLS